MGHLAVAAAMGVDMKRTPWFKWPEMPTRAGFYEVRFVQWSGAYSKVRRWEWRKNGEQMQWFDVDGFRMSSVPGDEWRGLTKEAR